MKTIVDARELSTGWLNTSLAAASDDARPQLNRTTLFERFASGAVQLVASDGSVLFASAIPDDLGLAPSIDELPEESYVVIDRDGRMRNLMGWVLKDAKATLKSGMDPPPVVVEVRSAEEPTVPTLSPDLDRRVMVVTTERESLTLDLYEGAYLAWRPLFASHAVEATESVAFAPRLLSLLGRLKETSAPVQLSLSGPLGGAKFTVECEPLLQGILMPCQPGLPVPDDDDEDEDEDEDDTVTVGGLVDVEFDDLDVEAELQPAP